MRTPLPAWWWIGPGWALVAACRVVPEAPEVTSVSPSWAWTGESTLVTVGGSRFYPDVLVGSTEPSAQVDSSFHLYLQTNPVTQLEGVTLVDYSTLTASVPAGVAPGVYSLRVVTPSGQEAVLKDGFEVRDTRADRFSLSVTSAAWLVDTYAEITLSLLDPYGGLVSEPWPVSLSATSSAGQVVFEDGDLADQEPLDEGEGIAGTLRGQARVRVTSTTADTVTFSASSWADDSLTSAPLLMSWTAGPVDHLTVTLLDEDGLLTAGEQALFDIVAYDANDVPLAEGYPLSILLSGSCGDPSVSQITLADPGPYAVTFTQACAAEALTAQAQGVAAVSSAPFSVVPGPATHYDLRFTPLIVQAGGPLGIAVDAADDFGNIVTDYDGRPAPDLQDNLGGIDSANGIGHATCYPFTDGTSACFAQPEKADGHVTVTATGADGLEGSGAVTVQAAAATDLVITPGTASVRAGDDFLLTVALQDPYGNDVAFDPSSSAVSLYEDSGTLGCALAEEVPATYLCSLTWASPGVVVEGVVQGVYGQATTPLTVENADLDHVIVTTTGTPTTAGTPFTLSLEAFDVYENPYVRAWTGPTVDVSDTTGTLDPASVSLNALGEATVAASVTGAAEGDVITASQAGYVYGTSAPFSIRSGPVDHLSVDVAPWIEAGSEAYAGVAAVDAYENPVLDYSGVVQLSSRYGLCADTTVGAFGAGVATVALDCPTRGLQEVYDAADDLGNVGASDPFDVLDFGCATPPTARLLVDGDVQAVVCLVSGAARVTADWTGSTGGTYHLSDQDDFAVRTVSVTRAFDYVAPGADRLTLVAVDPSACAAQAEATIYVGEPDGSATGPVVVTPTDTSVASVGSTTVDVQAYSCSGDVAAGDLAVWADLGAPASADTSTTGAARVVSLDPSTGAASFGWDFDSGYDGEARLTVGSLNGAALGEATIDVTQDRINPTVALFTPSGNVGGTYDSVRIELTEPLMEGMVSYRTVSLESDAGTVPATVALDPDGQSIVITPTTPIDASTGVWYPTLTDSVRDLVGNKLSGDWTGTVGGWVGSFGAVTNDLPTLSGCAADVARFVPDGDDGAGEEADEVTFSPMASAAPAHWRLAVYDAANRRVRAAWTDGTDPTVAWDGRGDDGHLVGVGAYQVQVYAVDPQYNEAIACAAQVALDQHVRLP